MFHHSLLVWTNTASGFSPAMRSLVLFASRVEELVVPMRYKVRPFDGSFSTVKVFLKGSNLDIDKNKKQRKNINFFSANPSETVAFQNHLAISCIFIHSNSFQREMNIVINKLRGFYENDWNCSNYLVPALWKIPVSRLGFLRNLWTARALIISLFL